MDSSEASVNHPNLPLVRVCRGLQCPQCLSGDCGSEVELNCLPFSNGGGKEKRKGRSHGCCGVDTEEGYKGTAVGIGILFCFENGISSQITVARGACSVILCI